MSGSRTCEKFIVATATVSSVLPQCVGFRLCHPEAWRFLPARSTCSALHSLRKHGTCTFSMLLLSCKQQYEVQHARNGGRLQSTCLIPGTFGPASPGIPSHLCHQESAGGRKRATQLNSWTSGFGVAGFEAVQSFVLEEAGLEFKCLASCRCSWCSLPSVAGKGHSVHAAWFI